MQLLIVALVIGIFVHDQFGPVPFHLGDDRLLLVPMLATPLGLALLYALACRWALRALDQGRQLRALRRLDYAALLYRHVALLNYVLSLGIGGLTRLREWLGVASNHRSGPILIHDLLFMAPTLALIVWGWWCYYPIDRRMRETTLLRRLDQSLPVHPVWTRSQYLVSQLRHQVALVGLPLLILLAWREMVERFVPPDRLLLYVNAQFLFLAAGAGCVFLLAPVMLRHVWDTTPLPDGQLRDSLVAMCRQYRVRAREILLWRSFGGLINAAVMGLVAPLRYILLTDGLLEMMPQRQVQAVMAHELAHIRKHHMFWLLASALASLEILGLFWLLLIDAALAREWVQRALNHVPQRVHDLLVQTDVMGVLATILALLSWLLVFGWISRRFERQADTFAVQHLATEDAARSAPVGPLVIDAASARTMTQALQVVADFNNMSPTRRSWRHGSIRWRQNYLEGFIGQRVECLAIDRHVRIIKLLTALALLVGGLAEVLNQ